MLTDGIADIEADGGFKALDMWMELNPERAASRSSKEGIGSQQLSGMSTSDFRGVEKYAASSVHKSVANLNGGCSITS